MNSASFSIEENKIIIRVKDRVVESVDELFQTELLQEVVRRFLERVRRKQLPLAGVFGEAAITDESIDRFIEALRYLAKLEADMVPNVVKGSEVFFADKALLSELIEQLYNFWRSFDRFVICDSEDEALDQRPYRTFNSTVERLMHLVRQAYRDIEENLTQKHPNVYRQVHAGAEIATIAKPVPRDTFRNEYTQLNDVFVIRQVLLYPPLIFDPPMNKRKGQFVRVYENPLKRVQINKDEWLCFPAKVGELLILVYFHERFYEIGFGLSNLFELAEDEDLLRKPDAIYCYGVDGAALAGLAEFPTVYYEDEANDLLVGAVPNGDEFAYFGYLKKMILTLHNIKIMKRGNLPFHGALVKILLRNDSEATVLMIGDSGAGKSESLEALRLIGEEEIKDLTIIADDMGSIELAADGAVRGFGTETGAFLRLDDLQPGYAFGQLDRAIIMNPNRVNARIVLPVTTFATITKGCAIDFVLYVNNYEDIDEDHPILEKFDSAGDALRVFREGAVMSKGTTTRTGLVHSYFANIFGPPQNRHLHDEIAERFFGEFFKRGLCVGQIRTRLGVPGYESEGPRAAAAALLEMISRKGK